jgi:hypothetical protein
MRSAEKCLVKAVEMEAFAQACQTAAEAETYKEMAVSWRQLALRATLQDAFSRRRGLRLVK